MNYHQHMAQAHLQHAGAMRPNVNPKHVNEGTIREGREAGYKASKHHDDAVFTESTRKPSAKKSVDDTPDLVKGGEGFEKSVKEEIVAQDQTFGIQYRPSITSMYGESK